MDAEPEPSAPHPAEAATPLASRFSATRARIVAKGCLGARLIVDGEQELGPGVPLSHSAVELRDDAGLVKITVSPGQHPSWAGAATLTLECGSSTAAADWAERIAAANAAEDQKVWGVSGRFLESEKARFEALVEEGGGELDVFSLAERLGIVGQLRSECEGRAWDNDWSEVQARMRATPVQDMMLSDLMDIYKFAGGGDAPYGQGRLRGQKIAFADQLTLEDAASGGPARVGTATAFFSHPWKMRAREFFEVCVTAFGAEDFVWIDLYMHNQFSGTLGSEYWIDRFAGLVERIGKVVAVLTPWHDPIPLKRMWCLFELVCAMQGKGKGVTLELVLSEGERTSLIAAVRGDFTAVRKMLVDVSIGKAEATVPQDKDLIWAQVMKLPNQDHGCNVELKILLRAWVFETLRQAVVDEEARSAASEGGALEFASFANQVAIIFNDDGNYEEALRLYDRALKSREQALGPDHPHTADTVYNIALVHQAQGNKQEAKAMFLRCERAYAQAYGPEHSETVDARERAASCE